MSRQRDIAARFASDGFVQLPGVFERDAVSDIHRLASRAVGGLTAAQIAARWSTGVPVNLLTEPGFVEYIAAEQVLAALRDVGFPTAHFCNGYVVSKPPGSPRTFWHADWWGWNDAASYTGLVHQVAALLYLDDTSPENGCLRVVPGSHRRRHALHRPMSSERLAELRRAEDLNAPEFGAAEGEVDVAVRAGDLIVLDSRILHAAHANRSPHPRPAVLSWFLVSFEEWSDALRANLPALTRPSGWPEAEWDRVARLLPPATGLNQPAPAGHGLFPDERLTY